MTRVRDLSAEGFCLLGRVLYGGGWQRQVAADLGVSYASVRAMARGVVAVQARHLPVLRRVLLERANALRVAARDLPRR